MTGTSTLEVYDADILVAETGMIVCSMQVIKCGKRQRQRRRQRQRQRAAHPKSLVMVNLAEHQKDALRMDVMRMISDADDNDIHCPHHYHVH